MDIHLDSQVASGLAVAGLAGLAVGIEREWSGHATGPAARFAGARTFLLLGLLGGLAGWLYAGGLVVAGALLIAGGGALTVAAYVAAARRGGDAVEGTTEVAALVVLALGVVSGLGFPLLTSAVASVMVLALVEKTRIHGAIRRLGEPELAASLQFAVLALVILPILPQGPYGPYDSIRPRSLWTAVLIFSGINFAGHIARRAVGLARGYGLTGLIGGLVSSTAVTLQFARRSRREPGASQALALGVVGACTVLVVRVGLLSTLLNPAVGRALVLYILPVFAVGVVVLGLVFSRLGGNGALESVPRERSPLGLWSAVKLTAAFQVVLFVLPLVQDLWGNAGVRVSALILGLTDMDALTFSMARLGADAETARLAAEGVALGILSNTAFKLAAALALGTGAFRRVAGTGLLVLAGASCLGLWLAR
jgi:uncharacterized membrane protein (DUF4010 family)